MATVQRRERPRTMYATVHRLANDTPVLYLKPVVHSLTDGTPIPPPQPFDYYSSSPPTSPIKSISKYSPFPSPSPYGPQPIFGGPAQTFLGGGPLSSHPVSPCTSPSSGTSPASFSIGSSSPSIIEDDEEDSIFSDSRRNTWRSDRATIGNRQSRMYDWMPPPSIMEEERQPQRPRFVERFLKLRSGSTGRNGRYRMDSESVPLVGPQAYSFEGDGRLKESRMGRMRRSASVNLGLNLQDSNSSGKGGGVSDVPKDETGFKRRAYASNTFPRMARQKSMDLLSTVKRVSGSWWNHEDDSGVSAAEVWDRLATAEELERAEGTKHQKRNEEGDDDADAKTVLFSEPAPAIPELESIGVELLGGKVGLTELFDEIGR